MTAPLYAEPGLDSFRRTDPLARLQRYALWLAPVAVLGWWAVSHVASRPAERVYEPQPLAFVHATWEERCETCHTSARPIGADNWLARLTGNSHAGDVTCTKCHQGPGHHVAEKPGDAPACSACHREHQGETASLLRVDDEQCIRCHRNLADHTTRAGASFPNVTAFDGDKNHHPDFAPADPGRLKFNHRLHMSKEISRPADPNTPGGAKTPVQLQCSSCHQLGSGNLEPAGAAFQRLPGQLVGLARPSGAYLLPVTYEAHCQACHPLRVGYDPAVLSVPHRLEPDEVRAYLRGAYAPLYVKKLADLQEKELPRPLPGRPPRPAAPLGGLEEALRNPVARAEQQLYESRDGCVLCHHLEADPRPNTRTGEAPARWIEPTKVPAVWLQKASFNHVRHRLVECRSCHANADTSEKASDVLLPTIDNCFSCHSSARRPAARSDCVECHRYHNGDYPLEGKGTDRRGPPHPVPSGEFFIGPAPSP